MTIVLFWDIDGTLLTTGRAGIFAWEDAAREVTGQAVDLQSLPTAGLTDVEVAVRVLESGGQTPESRVVNRLLRAYEKHLPASLPRRKGRVMPGVREILGFAKGRSDIASLLLTGNTRNGAKAKLSYYGLDTYFVDGAYSTDAPDRPSIAKKAFEIARKLDPSLTSDHVFVIGDTHHDIRCARAIGAKCIAVASGEYTVHELEVHHPWWVVERLPEPSVFAEKMGLPYSKIVSNSGSPLGRG